MVVLRVDATDEEILGVVRRWVELLAAQDYAAAMDLTAHDEYYEWKPDLMRQVIEGYGLPEPHPRGPFRVTPLAEASGGRKPRHEVVRWDPPEARPEHNAMALGYVEFDLPLNGEWSDLTASFEIQQRSKGLLVLVLHEIHVF
jgi:hypothetical protein